MLATHNEQEMINTIRRKEITQNLEEMKRNKKYLKIYILLKHV